ncbi:hypothetical protein BFJ63_vAg12978 [Fusarium oxysporum f. sp. narcissi]|uniref:MYND-type domain-containing protein n=1 Tax=Fusarium oxysporum f. sp. narcissi TaxID=451672 RepID=A0A4Q2VFL6_FUSOX|nr:hypothetical protein BFJ63_vAg12978 [Fusarium oxysporum f. sp. narcissi]
MASNGAQLANLQDKEHFPAFDDLAWDNDLNTNYYREPENGFWEPRKHWDRDGLEIPVAIYTEARGVEISPSNLQVGKTVVIFYAVKHLFMDMTIGIRHEDLEYLKIFPISLDDMIQLSDIIQTHATLTGEMRTCHGCNKKSAKLMKCAKCGFFWYCSQNCQLRGWKENGHKEDYKVLRDGNFKGLFSIKWDEFHNHISFPLRVAE